jgi:glycosyltransferase involved in cell wall biosynthesis
MDCQGLTNKHNSFLCKPVKDATGIDLYITANVCDLCKGTKYEDHIRYISYKNYNLALLYPYVDYCANCMYFRRTCKYKEGFCLLRGRPELAGKTLLDLWNQDVSCPEDKWPPKRIKPKPQKKNAELVSVIMPVGKNEKESSYIRTIDSLTKTAQGKIEILFLADGWCPKSDKLYSYPNLIIFPSKENLGERKTVNRGVKLAKGKYIFRVDAHCKMSEGWDENFAALCSDKTLLVSILDALDEETWEGLNHVYDSVSVTPSCIEKWWGRRKLDVLPNAFPTMSLTGCGWFCERDYFDSCLRFDEDLSKWGCIGPELSIKVEKSGGQILVAKTVNCAHLFNTSKGYSYSEVVKTQKVLLQRYHKYLYTLAQKFMPVPAWEHIKEDYLDNWEKYFMYETDVERKDKSEVKDEKGKVIRRIIKIFKPVHYRGKDDPNIPEVGKRIAANAELIKIKIADLSADGTWNYTEYEGEKLKEWLFENE